MTAPRSPSGPRPHYGKAFRKRYMECPDTRCATLADHDEHDPHGPEHPDGWPVQNGHYPPQEATS